MRYPEEHREQVRRKILAVAAELFRQEGFAGVGIDHVMEAAGLTRGGFYGYFKSKGVLLREVLLMTPHAVAMLREARGSHRRAPAEATKAVLSEYFGHDLAAWNLCSLATLAGEVPRQDGEATEAFAAHLDEHLDELCHHVQKKQGAAARTAMLASLALMVGGLNIAKAVGDDKLARETLDACRKTALDLLLR